MTETLRTGPLSVGVRARCDTSPDCWDDAVLTVPLQCPTPGAYEPQAWWAKLAPVFPHSPGALYYLGFVNQVPTTTDWVTGRLSTLRATGSFSGVTCYKNDWRSWVIDLFPDPPAGDGFYYLVRGREPYCDETPTYRTFHPRENPADPGKRDEEIAVCPDP